MSTFLLMMLFAYLLASGTPVGGMDGLMKGIIFSFSRM
jgi:hypothetical protein